MTCIIAVRGSNGVVLAADRLEVQGNRTRKRDKIQAFPGREDQKPLICTGFAGVTGFRDKLWNALRTQLSAGFMTGNLETLEDVMMGIEDVSSWLFEKRFSQAGRPPSSIYGSLTVGLKNLNYGEASIRKLHPQGFSERIYDYDGIGSGGPYGVSLLKLVHGESKSIDELAKDCIATIVLIEEMDIDRNVGGLPDIVKVRDEEGIEVLDQEDIENEVEGIDRKSLLTEACSSLREAFDSWTRTS